MATVTVTVFCKVTEKKSRGNIRSALQAVKSHKAMFQPKGYRIRFVSEDTERANLYRVKDKKCDKDRKFARSVKTDGSIAQ